MDFDFSDEQQQLRDTVERYLADQYSFEHFRKVLASAPGWDAQNWRGLGELGLLGINVPADQGGLGFGPLETLAMMGACGRALVLEPVLSSAVIASVLLGRFRDATWVGELMSRMVSGEAIVVLAHFERDGGFDSGWVSTRARRTGESYVLDGHKAVVLHAPAATTLLVSARLDGAPGEPEGVGLFRVAPDAPGVRLDAYPTFDGQPAADVYLKGVRVSPSERLGAEGAALLPIQAALDVGLAALCAEAVGVMQAITDATVQYVQQRQQFGQPIGKFQALQHRIADMLIHLEQARSMSYLAALRCEHPDSAERGRALSAAKALVGQACRFVGQQAVQLHGGMGMTDELSVSHWFKRLTSTEILFGDSDMHLQRFAALSRSS